MLTLYQFQGLTFDAQAEYVWDEGVVFADRLNFGYKIFLYHLGPFYAEVWYDGESNKVDYINSFSTTAKLLPYLKAIDISEVTHL